MDEARDAGTSGILAGVLNLVAVFALVWGLWYVFMHPNGIMKLYTPMYGFSLVVALLFSIVLIGQVYELGGAEFGESGNRLFAGIGLTVVSVAVSLFLVYGFFWTFVGRLGITYFSPQSIVRAGGVGAEIYNARENASTALVYFFSAALWVALTWRLGFRRWPWADSSRGVLGTSRLFAISSLATVVYVVCFHPHVCQLFYPAQTMAGVDPWWSEIADTGSAFFSLGLLLCVLAWVVVSDVLWDGQPWRALGGEDGSLWSGLAALVGTVLLGAATEYGMLQMMIARWGEPFIGGQYTDGPDFRFLHAGEMAGCFILGAFVVGVYFRNLPGGAGPAVRAIVRTVVAAVLGAAAYFFYYSPATVPLLGKVPGIAQPGDTALVWIVLFLCVILCQAQLFRGWPLKARER